jgi:hypothetical protein
LPVLANLYLHYVLELVKLCRGKAYLVGYCDDFIGCVECKVSARADGAIGGLRAGSRAHPDGGAALWESG